MKKIFLVLGFLFLVSLSYSADLISNTTYYNLQHYKVVKSTSDANEPINKFYYRGDFYIVNDTFTIQIADITPYLILYGTGTIWAKRIETTDFVTVSSQTAFTRITLNQDLIVGTTLQVDTDVLYVDPTNNRVGINDNTPSFSLDVNGTGRFVGNVLCNSILGVGTNPLLQTTFSVDGGDSTASYIVGQFSNRTSGYGSFLQFSDGYTYNYSFGTDGATGDFAFISGRYPGVTGTERMRITQGGNLEVSGYSQFGLDAPSLKCIKLSTTTAPTEGGTTSIAHGISGNKIVSLTGVCVTGDATSGIIPCYELIAEYQYGLDYNSTNVYVRLHATNSGNILDKDIRIIIWYEE